MGKRLLYVFLVGIIFSLACTLTSAPDQELEPTAIPTIPTRAITPTLTLTPAVTALPTAVPLATNTAAASACTNRATYISDVNIPDGTPIQHGVAFSKTWRMQNTGTCIWGSGYVFAHISGSVVPVGDWQTFNNVRPGDTIDITVSLILDPARTYTYGAIARSTFQMQAPDGTRFGSRPYIEVVAQPADQTTCINDSDYVRDISVPDGTPIQHGLAFTKTWRIKNSGTCIWDDGYQFVHVSGEIFPATSVPMPVFDDVQPGETIDITVTLMLPPERQYTYGQPVRSTFQMQAPNGTRFGTRPYVEVVPQRP